jgi:hypothetical protein
MHSGSHRLIFRRSARRSSQKGRSGRGCRGDAVNRARATGSRASRLFQQGRPTPHAYRSLTGPLQHKLCPLHLKRRRTTTGHEEAQFETAGELEALGAGVLLKSPDKQATAPQMRPLFTTQGGCSGCKGLHHIVRDRSRSPWPPSPLMCDSSRYCVLCQTNHIADCLSPLAFLSVRTHDAFLALLQHRHSLLIDFPIR